MFSLSCIWLLWFLLVIHWSNLKASSTFSNSVKNISKADSEARNSDNWHDDEDNLRRTGFVSGNDSYWVCGIGVLFERLERIFKEKMSYNITAIDAIIAIITIASILNTIASSHAAARTVGTRADFAECGWIRTSDFAFVSWGF